jgi:hypothetical protein
MQKLHSQLPRQLRVEVQHGIPVIPKTVSELRELPTWPDGLLEGRRKPVLDYLDGGTWSLVSEFTEVESGKRAKAALTLLVCTYSEVGDELAASLLTFVMNGLRA